MNWADLPFRHEDPCDQVTEHFDMNVPKAELTLCLNALSRQGFIEIFYELTDSDVDESYQEVTYHVTANRNVCACKRKIDYLKCSPQ